MTDKQPPATPYTCNDYRAEMILLALRQRLQRPDLSEEERRQLAAEITRLEESIGF